MSDQPEPVYIGKARCVHAFETSEKGELPLKPGDIVFVEEIGDSGWWLGECKGRRGYFSGAFVELVEDDGSQPASSLSTSTTTPVKPQETTPLPLALTIPNKLPVIDHISPEKNAGVGVIERVMSKGTKAVQIFTKKKVLPRAPAKTGAKLTASTFRREPRKPTKDPTISSKLQGSTGAVIKTKTEVNAVEDSASRKHLVPGAELDKRRAFIAKEIYDTEVTYVKALLTAVNGYLNILRTAAKNDPNIPIDVVLTIFGNVETILPLNQDLLRQLQERIEKWTNTTTIGDVFKTFVPFLKMYSIYGNHYDTAMDALDDCWEKGTWITRFVEKKVTIESLLITPIQRLPRYQLLIEDLWKHTLPEHPDFQDLGLASKQIKEVADHVNNSMRKLKDTERLTAEGFAHLLGPARSVVLDGNLEVLSVTYGTREEPTKNTRLGKYKFILFNDILVHVDTKNLADPKLPTSQWQLEKEAKKKKKMAVPRKPMGSKKKKPLPLSLGKQTGEEWIWPLQLVWLVDGSKTGFDIIGPNKTLSVMGDSKENKDQWFNTLKTHIETSLLRQPKFDQIKDLRDLSINLTERWGRHQFNNAEIFTGTWLKGVMHGKGTLEFFGNFYEGDFADARRTGQGKLEYNDGSIFVGEFIDGKPSGFGELTTKTGDTYVGEFKNGLRNGEGDLIWANGDSYVGEWVNGHMEGRGVLRSFFGILYDGGFHESQFSGTGILETPEGSYEGEFEFGYRQGQGNMRYNDGAVYEGAWRDDLWHGHGRWTSNCGTYEGDFVKGRREGQGRMDYNSKRKPPVSQAGQPQPQPVLQQSQQQDEIYYEGAWKEDRPHGLGTFVNSTAYEYKYEGEHDSGRRTGKGVLHYANGSKWEGNFEKNKPSGNGKLTYTDGLTITGKWKAGMRDPKCTVSNESLTTSVSQLSPQSESTPAGTTTTQPNSALTTSNNSTSTPNLTSLITGSQNSHTISVDEEKAVEEDGYAEFLPPPVFPFINISHLVENH